MDYQDLLQPIAPDNAVGHYLKSDRTSYRALRNSFNAAQSSFRRLTETPESSNDEALFEENLSNWQTVNQNCWQTLTEQSKDIEIYCWWVMSLAFQDQSIEKIAQALSTLVDFIDTFWPDVQPYLPDEKLKSSSPEEQASERAELQLRPLIQLLGESNNSGLLFMPLQMMSLVGDIDHSQYFSANKAGTLPALKEQAKSDFSTYQTDITATIHALDLAMSSLDKLDAWMAKTTVDLAITGISSQFLKANLNDNLQAIKFLVADCYATWPLDINQEEPTTEQTEIGQVETSQPAQVQPEQVPTVQVTQQPTHSVAEVSVSDVTTKNINIQLNNRDAAFEQLRTIADYFAKTEPHSPISFLLEKAIRWGYMPLPELMKELVSGNEQVLEQINLVTGLNSEANNLTNTASANHSTQAKDSVINDSASENASLNQSNTQDKTLTSDTTNTASDSEFNW